MAAAGKQPEEISAIIAAVIEGATVDVDLDLDPAGQAVERALGIGELVVRVERAGRERVGLGQRDGQQVVRERVRPGALCRPRGGPASRSDAVRPVSETLMRDNAS